MFPQQPKATPRPHIVQPKQPSLPANSKVKFDVRYPGGRKPFEDRAEAMAFAEAQRSTEKGWAEVVQVIETIVSPRA